MIYFLGMRKSNIILFNSDLLECKTVDSDKFYLLLLNKTYTELLDEMKEMENLNSESKKKNLLNMLKTNNFPLSNYNSLCNYLLYNTECQYFIQTLTSMYMEVVTADMCVETVLRIDNNTETLNSKSYWMTWPEGTDYEYGKEISCCAFEYVCEINKTFKEAKKELIDFANTGLEETLARQEVLGIDTGCHESKELPGLVSWTFPGEDGEYDEVEVPEGVNILDINPIPKNVKINKLILPNSLLFILPNTFDFNREINNLDLSKTSVTKIYKPIKSFYSYTDRYIMLPEHAVEVSEILNVYGYNIYVPKNVKKLRRIECYQLSFESDSQLYYLGSGIDVYKKSSRVKLTPEELKNGKTYTYYGLFSNLKFIESDTFELNRDFNTIIGIDWKLSDITTGVKNRISKLNCSFLLNIDSEAYEYLKDLKNVKGINKDEIII